MGIAVVTAVVAPAGMQWGALPVAAAWPLEMAATGERPGAPMARAWPLAVARTGPGAEVGATE